MKNKLALFWIILLLALFIGGCYVNWKTEKKDFLDYVAKRVDKYGFLSPISNQYVFPAERRDTTSAVIDRYFVKVNSPLFGLGSIFYDTANSHNLPPYLLASVAMVESTGGKFIKKGTFNPFGWNHGLTRFHSFADSVVQVGAKISQLSYYARFRKTKRLEDFCQAYNPKFAKKYCQKITWFMKELKKEELK